MKSKTIISRRYAKGLLGVLQDNELDSVENELGEIVKQKKTNLDFNNLLEDPSFTPLECKKVIKKIIQKYNFNNKLEKFLSILVDKGRINLVSDIFHDFVGFLDRRRGRLRALLTSARPIGADLQVEFEKLIAKKYRQEIILETKIDKKLLAGIRIEIQQEVYDGTLKAKLDGIRTKLTYAHG